MNPRNARGLNKLKDFWQISSPVVSTTLYYWVVLTAGQPIPWFFISSLWHSKHYIIKFVNTYITCYRYSVKKTYNACYLTLSVLI